MLWWLRNGCAAPAPLRGRVGSSDSTFSIWATFRSGHLDEPAVLDLERQVVLRDRLQEGGGGELQLGPQPGRVVEFVERTVAGGCAGQRAGSGPSLLVYCGVAHFGRWHSRNAAPDAAQVLVGDQGPPAPVLHLDLLVPAATAPRGQVRVTLPASLLNDDRGRRLVQEARAEEA